MTAQTNQSADPSPARPLANPPLDEVMLAMDIVDTLRRRERLVQREIESEGREEDLKARLRKIYAAQGIDVPDHVLAQGVAAIKEDRFVYRPPPPVFRRRLATVYVTRGRWGRWFLGALAAALAAAGIYAAAVVLPAAKLPKRIEARYAEVTALAVDDHARARAGAFRATGLAAHRNGNAAAAQAALAGLDNLNRTLALEYTLRVVNRPGERSGVWRIPDVNESARNYYLVVEAIDSSGRALELPIVSEETGRSRKAKVWGLRVDESVFKAVAADKQDDGIIQKNRVGIKQRGHLVPNYELATTGGAIAEW